jgi:hypothetical protein
MALTMPLGTVQTGLATSFFAILDVIVFLVLPSNDL